MKDRKYLAATVALLPFVFFCSIADADLQSESLKVLVAVNQAVVRFEPSTSSPVVATASRGDVLEVLQKTGAWYSVIITLEESNMKLSGYIQASDVEAVAETSTAAAPQTGGAAAGMTAPTEYRYAASRKILCTTADFKYDYEIKGIITHTQPVSASGQRPVASAIRSGMPDFETIAIEMEGDAVIGLGYDVFTDPADNSLRVLIYGTVIKFR